MIVQLRNALNSLLSYLVKDWKEIKFKHYHLMQIYQRILMIIYYILLIKKEKGKLIYQVSFHYFWLKFH